MNSIKNMIRRPYDDRQQPATPPSGPLALTLAALPQLSDRVAVPRYSRSDLTAGIVHIGLGNFHRAHQAVYLDNLFNGGQDHDWAVVGAGVRPHDGAMRKVLAGQDWLTTVVEQEAGSTTARVTGVMIDYVDPEDPAALIERLADPAIRIAALTVTEGGYCIDPATGRFDSRHPDIVADAANPSAPRSAFGVLLAALVRRRAAGTAPFTVMSCDNVFHNGVVTRNAVSGLAELIDPALAAWVRQSVAFPNSMVDGITPATSDRERQLLAETFGVADGWPVFCESFRQWVLEDNFPAGRPQLERVGVTFVTDVSPFERMKMRILNGGHAAICYPSALLDILFVHDAMAHPLIKGFLDKLEITEIVPIVGDVPGADLDAYYQLIVRRFSNPMVADTITRLCQDGGNRQPKFILPSARDRLDSSLPVDGLPLVSALWCRYCVLESDSGKPIAPNDPNAERLKATALAARTEPGAFLAMDDIFGDLGSRPAFATAFAQWLARLWSDGTEATLRSYLATSE